MHWIYEMKNYYFHVIFSRNVFNYLNKYIRLLLGFSLFFVFTNTIHAAEHLSVQNSKKNESEFKSRVAIAEPEFFSSVKSSEVKGFYFGVGFRNVRLQVADDVTVSNSDGTSNGIGTNLGYFWEEHAVEYEHQITIIEHTNSLSYETQSGQKLEVIQNNFWYLLYPKIGMNFYLHYGAGIQLTKTRFAATGSITSFEDEIAMGAETGVTYFVMSNLKLFYRFSVGRHIPFLKTSDSSAFLKQSQLHTIYLNYYIPL